MSPARGRRVEYPIEVPYEGRIVGEIHIDHVRVNYQKNAFEYDTVEWKHVVRTLRGDGPLRPNIARAAGYATNESPIGRLFTGYRRLDPGLKYLVPGDGDHAIHEKAVSGRSCSARVTPSTRTTTFGTSRPSSTTSRRSSCPAEATDPEDGDDDARSRLDIPDPTDSQPQPGDPTPPRETEDQKQERYRQQGSVLHDISGEYALPGFGNALKVTVYGLNWHRGRRTPTASACPSMFSSSAAPTSTSSSTSATRCSPTSAATRGSTPSSVSPSTSVTAAAVTRRSARSSLN